MENVMELIKDQYNITNVRAAIISWLNGQTIHCYLKGCENVYTFKGTEKILKDGSHNAKITSDMVHSGIWFV